MTSAHLLPIKSIKQASQLQPRAKMDTEKIDEYTAAMKAGEKFPAVLVFDVDGEYYLVDGYHRYLAVQGAKFDKILAEIRTGTMRDAILESAGANAKHGLNRTPEDKRRAVLLLLRDKIWVTWNNQKIAKQCGVSDELVRKIRAEIHDEENTSPSVSSNVGRIPSKKMKVERAGKTYKMDTSGMRKSSNPGSASVEEVPTTSPISGAALLGKDPESPIDTPAQPPAREGPAPEQCTKLVQAPCISGMPCTRGKVIPANSVHGKRCGVIMIDIKQLPDYGTGVQECPVEREIRMKGTEPEGFRQAGSGQPSASPAAAVAPVANTYDAKRARADQLAKEWLSLMPGSADLLVTDIQRERPELKTVSDVLYEALAVLAEKGGV